MKKNFTILIFVFSFLSEVGFAQCPTASFTINNYQTACPPLLDSFINTSTNTQVGSTYYYSFGDGSHSTIQNPFHVYLYGGTFYPSLIVTNLSGCADTFVSPTPVVVGGVQVTSHVATPSIGIVPLHVNLQVVSNSTSYIWDFNDGSPLVINGTSPISHIYITPGIYYPSVVVSEFSPAGCIYTLIVDTVNVICSCPKPTNPFTTIISNTKAKLNWTTQSCALGYKIRFRKVGVTAWTNIIIGTNIGFRAVSGLTPNSTYQWQVRSICNASPLYQSAFTALQTFSTPLRLEDENETLKDFFIFPNPSSSTINISSTNLSGKYSLKIYNIFGQQLKQQEIDFSFEGNIKINIESLTSGYYQLMLVNGSNVMSKRFVKE